MNVTKPRQDIKDFHVVIQTYLIQSVKSALFTALSSSVSSLLLEVSDISRGYRRALGSLFETRATLKVCSHDPF